MGDWKKLASRIRGLGFSKHSILTSIFVFLRNYAWIQNPKCFSGKYKSHWRQKWVNDIRPCLANSISFFKALFKPGIKPGLILTIVFISVEELYSKVKYGHTSWSGHWGYVPHGHGHEGESHHWRGKNRETTSIDPCNFSKCW